MRILLNLIVVIVIVESSPLAKSEWIELGQKTIVFHETSKWIHLGVEGTDSAQVYSSPSGKVCRYAEYCVFLKDKGVGEAKATLIFAKKHGVGEDSLCFSTSDSTIFSLNSFGLRFFGIKDNYLFIDMGTAPWPRGLVIYDLAKRDTVLHTKYSEPIFIDSTSTLSYWMPIGLATKKTCTDFDKIENADLVPSIEQRCLFKLSTRLTTMLNEKRCVGYQ